MHVERWGELSVCCGDTAPLGVAESWGAEKSLSVLCPPLSWPRDAAYLQDPAWGSEAVAVCSSLCLTDTLLPGLRTRAGNSSNCKICQRQGNFLTCFELQCGPRNGCSG